MLSLCEKILAQDRRIGFAMVTTMRGEIIDYEMAGETLMPEEDIANFGAVWAAMIAGMVQQMEKYFGRSEIVSLGYEKLNLHGIIVGDRIIVVTARKDLPLNIVLGLKAL